MSSIYYYKSTGYGAINLALRLNALERESDAIQAHVASIDAVMKRGDRPIKLFRGVRDLMDIIESQGGTDRMIELGYTSASRRMPVAQQFVDGECCLVVFVLPPEIKRYDFQDEKYEDEVLIQRNVQIILNDPNSYNVVNGKRVFTATIEPYTPPAKTAEKERQMAELKEEIDCLQIASDWKQEIEEMGEEVNDASIADMVDTMKVQGVVFTDAVLQKIIAAIKDL
jgi:hypothetical protein